MTSRWPGRIEAALVMPLTCMSAESGTPFLRATVSSVSPWLIVTGCPPSQVQWPVGTGAGAGAAAGCAGTEPVYSGAPGR